MTIFGQQRVLVLNVITIILGKFSSVSLDSHNLKNGDRSGNSLKGEIFNTLNLCEFFHLWRWYSVTGLYFDIEYSFQVLCPAHGVTGTTSRVKVPPPPASLTRI